MSKYLLSKEYEQFTGLNNVCFLPHRSYLDGMRERHAVHYPLARMIAQGMLSHHKPYSYFKMQSTLVLCNLRPRINGKTDVRPDILAISDKGNVLIVECKVRTRGDGDDLSACMKLSGAATQLMQYSTKLKDFARSALEAAAGDKERVFTFWHALHESVYSRIHGFPPLNEMLNNVYSMSEKKQKKWVVDVFETLANGKALHALAFNGPPDDGIPGFAAIQSDIITAYANNGWNPAIGKLALIVVDHIDSSFKI